MDLLSNLDEEAWTDGDPDTKTGFGEYRIAKKTKEDVGHYSYAVFDNFGNLQTVHLKNADPSYDPLHNINNCELRLNEEGNTILGICIEDDCVLNKSLLTTCSEDNNESSTIKENGIENSDENEDNSIKSKDDDLNQLKNNSMEEGKKEEVALTDGIGGAT